jgi:hypothetical protein
MSETKQTAWTPQKPNPITYDRLTGKLTICFEPIHRPQGESGVAPLARRIAERLRADSAQYGIIRQHLDARHRLAELEKRPPDNYDELTAARHAAWNSRPAAAAIVREAALEVSRELAADPVNALVRQLAAQADDILTQIADALALTQAAVIAGVTSPSDGLVLKLLDLLDMIDRCG